MAGLSAAIHLAMEGKEVLVFEKNQYPHHKVCGEYISREILPYLDRLGIGLQDAVHIDTFQLSTKNGKTFETKLPLGGIGLSRYALDHRFYLRAVELGVSFSFKSVKSVCFSNNQFTITDESGQVYSALIAVGAYGKRSELDKKLDRAFAVKKSPWVGVKAHYYHPKFNENRVELHNFRGGYGGLSRVENNIVNFCYLADYKNFKIHKGIENFNNKIVSANPFLRNFLESASPVFEKPLAIAQFSFSKKKVVENHLLMCGDTAGLIHPLCGNGMAMAIHSAKLASECILKFMTFKKYSRNEMESEYSAKWKLNFANRLSNGRRIQSVLLKPVLTDQLLIMLAKTPGLMNLLIKRTHGKLIE